MMGLGTGNVRRERQRQQIEAQERRCKHAEKSPASAAKPKTAAKPKAKAKRGGRK